jgi:hypothetical protein
MPPATPTQPTLLEHPVLGWAGNSSKHLRMQVLQPQQEALRHSLYHQGALQQQGRQQEEAQ